MKRYRENALIIARQRADEVPAAGDVEGQLVWTRSFVAIKELLAAQPAKTNT